MNESRLLRSPRKLRALMGGIVGVGISLAGLIFVGMAVARHRDDIEAGVAVVSPVWAAGALAASVAGMTLVALVWHRSLKMFGIDVTRSAAVTLYYRGEIGKYVPGGVWPIVGRAELTKRTGASAGPAYNSVLVALAALYLAAAGVSLLTFASNAVSSLSVWLLLGVATVALALHPRAWEKLGVVLQHVSGRRLLLPSRLEVAGLVLRSVPAWILIGTSTWIIARAMSPDIGYVRVVSATAFSWLVGFLAVPAPGGLGVREAVFVAAMGNTPTGVAAATALLGRLAFMLTDGVGALVATFAARWCTGAGHQNSDEDD